MKMKTEIILIFYIFIKIKFTEEKDFFEFANEYQNELCSYNGIPTYDPKTNQVRCECDERHENEPRIKKRDYIHDHLVQCSYEKKSRFFAFFLAAIFPIGLDFLYLGHVGLFLLSLLLFITVLVVNVIQIIFDYKNNYKNNNKKDESINHRKYKFNIRNSETTLKRINMIGINIIFVIYYISHIVIQGLGLIKDSNSIETENDMIYFFSKPED
jgi:hypothetical protein